MSPMKVARSLTIFLVLSLCLAPRVEPRGLSKAAGEATDEGVTRQATELLALSAEQNKENHPLALQTARRALALWQATADKAGTARAYFQVARCLLAQSDLPEAVENYERALQLWRDLGDTREQAATLIMMGITNARAGEWAQSLSLFLRAQGLIKDSDEPYYLGQIASGLGYIFNESGLPEKGLIQYQRALAYYLRTPDERDNRRSLLGVGYTYYLLGNYPEALSHLRQAVAGFAPRSLDAAEGHEYLGRVHIAMGQYDVALPHLEFALVRYTEAVNPKEAARVRALIARACQRQGRLARARAYYRRALAAFGKLSDRINQAAVYYGLGQLELKSGNYAAAEDYLRQSIKATEDVRRVSTSSDLTAAFSATVHERYEQYVECLMRRHEAERSRGLDARAFETSELARARSLAELLRDTQTNLVPGLDPQLAGREKSLRQSLRVKEDYRVALLGKETYRKEELAALEAELGRLEAEYQQVTETIRARYPSYGRLTRPVAWDLGQIQKEVITDDETVLLEYSLGADKSYVWAVTRDGFKSYELAARPLIDESARRVYEALASPPSGGPPDGPGPAAQELAQLILTPVASELKKRRIIVVADGALNYIPFQALPSPTGEREPLVAGHEIVNAPSASILGELREEAARRRPAAKTLAAFGDPVFPANYAQRKAATDGDQSASASSLEDGRLQAALRDVELKGDTYDPAAVQPLFYNKQELAYLRGVASDEETFVAEGFDASRERLRGTDLSGYAILHFATHGFLDPARPENSGLMLSTVDRDGRPQDGFVGLQDVYGLRAPVELVVLSACSTALGKEVRGEGLIGLTRGFMYAGASSVLASLWKVDDEATAELMKRFYGNLLRRGMTPAEALRAAQNSIRREPQWGAPYYWAGFTLQGEYRQVIRSPRVAVESSTQPKMISVVVLFGLLAAAAWWVRRRAGRAQESGDYSTVKR
ncbi:MAG TPA: CHAT domain-containing tetratricopeptide repeat protein [Pyrinomonadaceae bacterium]